MLYPVELQAHVAETCIHWSGQGDLNSRPPAPKAGALPDCAMPRASRVTYATSLAHPNDPDKFSQLKSLDNDCHTELRNSPQRSLELQLAPETRWPL